MLDDFVIVGIVMALTQLIKLWMRKRMDLVLARQLTPLVVLVLAAGLNVINAAVFGMGQVATIDAVSEGLKLGAIAGGIYSMGRAALRMP
jgi:hypothetical protein